MYSSFLKPYNPRRSHSDASIESHSSNESGYGGSSPVFSRQNSNSTLTFNQEAATVSFSTSQPQSQPSPQPWVESTSSRKTHPRDAPNPEYAHQNTNSSPRNQSNRRDHSDQTRRNPPCHRDAEPSPRHSGGHRDSYDSRYDRKLRETSDFSETDSSSSQKNSRSKPHGHADKGYSSPQWRNGDPSSQRKSAHAPEERSEPEPDSELNCHQVRLFKPQQTSQTNQVYGLDFFFIWLYIYCSPSKRERIMQFLSLHVVSLSITFSIFVQNCYNSWSKPLTCPCLTNIFFLFLAPRFIMPCTLSRLVAPTR